MTTPLSILEATDINSLYGRFINLFVTVQPRSFYGLGVYRPTDLQALDYNNGQPVNQNIELLNSDDVVLAFSYRVCKMKLPLVVSYARKLVGDGS